MTGDNGGGQAVAGTLLLLLLAPTRLILYKVRRVRPQILRLQHICPDRSTNPGIPTPPPTLAKRTFTPYTLALLHLHGPPVTPIAILSLISQLSPQSRLH